MVLAVFVKSIFLLTALIVAAVFASLAGRSANKRPPPLGTLVTPVTQEGTEPQDARDKSAQTNSEPLLRFEVFSATVPEGELSNLELQALFQSATHDALETKLALEQ